MRVVLDQLGVRDYGIYSAVGGLVALTSFLPSSIAQATQRFLSFALGAQDTQLLKKTFSMSLALYLIIALIGLAVLITAGQWFVDHKLSLPENRFEAAQQLYSYAVLNLHREPDYESFYGHYYGS